MVAAMRLAGFAAWYRPAGALGPGSVPHIHAIAIGDAELSPAARRQIDGPEGYFRGLDGLPPEKRLEHAVAQARKIASKGPAAIAAAKRILRATAAPQLAAGQEMEADAFGMLFGTEDGREGLKAFVEKRPAQFTGQET